MSNLTETPDKGEPDHFAEIAAELRRAADGIETLVGSGLPKPGLFELNIQPGTRDDDESTRRSVDAIAWALCGESGKVRDVSDGRYHFSAKGRSGPISFSVYLSVSAEWAVKREAAAELAKREAELEKLRAEVADLRSGLGFSREADDPTPVSPARVPLHNGGVVNGDELIDETEPQCTPECDELSASVGAPSGLARSWHHDNCPVPVHHFAKRGFTACDVDTADLPAAHGYSSEWAAVDCKACLDKAPV